MKIAIVGSRGIPNNYGGFEQFAEYLSISLVKKGHEVWVCNPHYHSFSSDHLDGVNIKHIYNPETLIGTSGNFIYDLLCLRFTVKEKPDIILMLGYTTSSVWFRFFNFGHSELVTNLDGLEWKRDKWGPILKRITLWFEKLAVRYGGNLVADHPVIQDYFREQHHQETTYIPYGANVFINSDERILEEYHLKKKSYCLLIARFEAEHNIDMVIKGYLESNRKEPLLLVGNHTTLYGKRLYRKYHSVSRLRFLGGIYDMKKLNNLRYFCSFYFHGHSIGGTNPSLLEAMAAGALIVSHENAFNKAVLGPDAYYFNNENEVKQVLDSLDPDNESGRKMKENNIIKISTNYNWKSISDSYEALFMKLISKHATHKSNP